MIGGPRATGYLHLTWVSTRWAALLPRIVSGGDVSSNSFAMATESQAETSRGCGLADGSWLILGNAGKEPFKVDANLVVTGGQRARGERQRESGSTEADGG